MIKIKNNYVKLALSYIVIIFASIMAAYSLETFLIPNNILDGGVTGISIIISKVFSIPISFLVVLINIPFVYIGYRNLGKSFLIRTVFSMLTFSYALTFFGNFHEVTDEILKTEYYEIKPMTPEDAKLKLQEKPSQLFLTFVNVETGKVNVIHRLKDNKNFGLIEPEA